ncbi:hypothetical protein HII36_12605 [Nonomuraea sp. NN258]|uniref:hypothetical protein n=1 Tax=Nonomuraea antri TaxID=2730852 RepID=UPI00156888DA|nr:hypothetical protein [Nonomuraea antri]NRQ32672.1 hypothetical protein [Nonomuraea antri]
MASQVKANQGPLLFWCGVAVAEFGAIQPGFGVTSAYVGAALLIGLGLLTLKVSDYIRSEQARQRLRLGGYLAGALVVAHGFGSGASPIRVGAIVLYAVAAVMAVWHHRVPIRTRGSLVIATGMAPDGLRRLLNSGDTVAVYRTEHATHELRELESRYGLVLVVGDEHDPRVKERLSASGLSRQVPDIAERDVLVAGPRRFKQYVGGALSRLAIPRSQIHFKSL